MNTSPRGRPRVQESADDIVAGVLVAAGARVSTPAYTTRRIADLTGLSQTLVSRSVRRIRRPGADSLQTGRSQQIISETERKLQLAAFHVEYPVLTLRFEVLDDQVENPQPRVFDRRAAALMAALRVSGASEWPTAAGEQQADGAEAAELSLTPGPPTAGPSSTGEAGRGKTAESALPERKESAVSEHWLTLRWQPGTSPWAEFLSEVAQLLDRCRPTQDAVPAGLLRQLAARAGRGLHGVAWRRGHTLENPDTPFDSNALALIEYPAPGRTGVDQKRTARSLSATEQIAIVLRKEMTSSGFRAGDRLSVSQLAQRLGLRTARVRNAMRQLADDGLLTHSQAGFRIPHLSGTDVIDLYAARLHVGMVILRACAAQPRHRLLPARLALGTLEAVARQGSLADAGEADLRFQQELADAAGLQQSAHIFHALTLRLRMFISVLQLDYTPAADRLVADDRRLLAAVLEGRADEAVRIWRSKLDDAVRHMSAVAPDSVNPRLWSQLTA